jgi:hypothetical protein
MQGAKGFAIDRLGSMFGRIQINNYTISWCLASILIFHQALFPISNAELITLLFLLALAVRLYFFNIDTIPTHLRDLHGYGLRVLHRLLAASSDYFDWSDERPVNTTGWIIRCCCPSATCFCFHHSWINKIAKNDVGHAWNWYGITCFHQYNGN